MINWLLTFSLLGLLYITYKMDRRCFLSPSFIVVTVMLISSIVVSINTDYWEYEISFYTFFLIIGSIILFILGQYAGQHSKTRIITRHREKALTLHSFKVPSLAVYFMVLLSGVITLYLYYRQQSRNASIVGMASSIAGIVQANRYYVGDNGVDSSAIKLLLVIYKVITYSFLFVYFYNRINKKERSRGLLTAIITIIYFGCCALSTNRADIITGASYLVFLIMYLSYYKNGWVNSTKINRKLVARVGIIAVVMIVLFRYLGTLTGKSGMYTAYDNISIYVGSSIVCFDKYITGTSNLPQNFSVTLMGSLWNMLNRFGANIHISEHVWSHQYWMHGASNVYTSIFPLYVKFGAIGTFFLELLFGFISGSLWYRLKQGIASWAFVVVFGSFFFCFTYYSIAERVFSQLFTLTSVIEIIVTYFIISKLDIQSL